MSERRTAMPMPWIVGLTALFFLAFLIKPLLVLLAWVTAIILFVVLVLALWHFIKWLFR